MEVDTVPATTVEVDPDPDLEAHEDGLDDGDEATITELLGLESDEDDGGHVPWDVEAEEVAEEEDAEEDTEVVVKPVGGAFCHDCSVLQVSLRVGMDVNVPFHDPRSQVRSSTTRPNRGCPPQGMRLGSSKPGTRSVCPGPTSTHRADRFRTLT